MQLFDWLRTTKTTYAAFGALAGVDKATVHRLARRKQLPTVPLVKTIADITGGAVGLDDWGDDEPKLAAKTSAQVAA